MKEFVVTGMVITNALLGHLCLMPTVYAHDIAMTESVQMEMVMSPMVPMSPVHCKHCVAVASGRMPESLGATSCSGHCLSQGSTAVALVANERMFPIDADGPSRAMHNIVVLDNASGYIDAMGPPGPASLTKTIVLLQ